MQALRAAKAWSLSAVGRRMCAGRGRGEVGGRGGGAGGGERDVWV